jgi:nucleotide-binding universal stress UspA family protein
MIEANKRDARSHMVVVVGVDLTDVTEHLLASACDLVRSIDDAELHVVHVIQPPPLLNLLVEPVRPTGVATRAHIESVRRQLQGFCDSLGSRSKARVVLHTPVGRTPDELTRIARETLADIIVVEVHDHTRRVFHHSVVARIARTAPCSLLALRDPARGARKQTPAPQVTDGAMQSATAQ